MFTHEEFASAVSACDEALKALESGDEVAASMLADLDRALHLLSSLALSEVNQSWRAAADSLITRRLFVEHRDCSFSTQG